MAKSTSKSKSTQKRSASMKSKETKSSSVESGVRIVALQDTQLANGNFIAKGTEVKVAKAYADAALGETNPHFALA